MFKRFKTAWKMAKDINPSQFDGAKEITPMTILPNYKNNKPVWKDWNHDNAVKYGYKASTWVYSCINRIAKTASSVPWKVYRKNGGTWEEIEGHPLQQLMERPNPYMAGQDMMERLITHLYLGGNGILSKVRAGNNVVAEVWPLSPNNITPIPSRINFVEAYEYKRNNITERVPAEDIVHFMFIDPSNVYWGISPLQAVARTVDSDSEMVNWMKVSLQNRAIADGVFTFKHPLTQEQWEEARAQIREQHQGSNNARMPWVLGGEASWEQMSLSPAEMDFIESRKFTREEICSVFGTPPPMVGIYENATLANIETARKIFWLDTIIPLLEDIKSSLNLTLTPEFGDDLYLDFDTSNVEAIQENFHEKVQTANTLWSMGVPFNEINSRLELGFDEVPGGGNGYLPLNLAIAGAVMQENNLETEDLKRGAGPSHKKAWNLETEEQKTLYWKNLDDRRIGWIGQFTKKIEELFDEEARAIVETWEDSEDFDLVEQAIEGNEETWEKLMTAFYMAIIEDFGNETWNSLEKQAGPSFTKAGFDPWDRMIRSWVVRKTAEKVRHVLQTTKDLIRNVVAIGLDEGQSVDEISKGIREKYSSMSRRRSEVIARTETVSASNYGSWASAKQTGLNPNKVWVSSRDDRVRDSHKDEDLDGVEIGIDEYFQVGEDSMLAPGTGEIASENINCRCGLVYRVRR